MIDDLSKIPVIPDHERILMRQAWRREHPELDLHEACEPHPRFVDRVRRDWALHGRVANYRVTELRVKTDVIDYKPAAMLNLEELVKTVREEVPAAKVAKARKLLPVPTKAVSKTAAANALRAGSASAKASTIRA